MANVGLSRAMIVAIVAVISVALIAAVVFFYLSGDGGNGGGEETFHEGDFVEYGTFYYYSGYDPGDSSGYVRYTITDIDDEWITVQATYLNPARIELMTNHFLRTIIAQYTCIITEAGSFDAGLSDAGLSVFISTPQISSA